jgi:hypothetical protein
MNFSVFLFFFLIFSALKEFFGILNYLKKIIDIFPQPVLTVDEYGVMLVAYFSQQATRLELVQWLAKRGIRNPHHFLNNLTHYLTTGQSLAVYDQNSEYLYGF